VSIVLSDQFRRPIAGCYPWGRAPCNYWRAKRGAPIAPGVCQDRCPTLDCL